MIRYILTLTLIIILTPVPAWAQSGQSDEITPEIIAALKKEPPLSQSDIDIFVKIMPKMSKVASDNPAEAIKIYEQAGLSELRFGLIFSKATVGLLVASGVPLKAILTEADMPEVLLPTAREQELIVKNLNALEAAFDTDR